MGRPKKKQEVKKEAEQTPAEVAPEVPVDTSMESEAPVNLGTPTLTDKDSKKEFESFLKDMEKQFGEGCVVSAEQYMDMERVSTRILLQDILLKGGLPKSSIVLKYGEPSSGKTLSCLYEASVFTKQGIPVLYIDAEHSFNKAWAVQVGNDPKYFHLAQPTDLEKAIDMADIAVRSRKFGMVIFDSLTAAIPKEAVDKSAYDAQMALQARLNSKLCQKITSGLQPENLKDPHTYNNTIVVWIAHLRMKVGVVYGNPETIPGGKAILFHSSYILKYSKGAALKDGEDIIGGEIRIKVDKAKYSRPHVHGVTDFYFDPPRINNAKTLMVYAIQLGFIQRAGAYYTYQDIQAQGQAELFKSLYARPELLKKLKEDIIKGLH